VPPLRAATVLALAIAGGPPAAAQGPQPEPSFRFLGEPPVGLPPPAPPPVVPTEAMFELGRRLFADPILSDDRTVSCQSCHLPELAFGSREPLPPGVRGRRALRHAPVLLNRAWGRTQRWDGRTGSIEEFVLQPIADANEMNLPVADALARLAADAEYHAAFAKTFADGVSEANLRTSLATFVRGIASGDTPYDRFLRGEVDAFTAAERAGLWVFESKGACWKCHTPPLFTDESFHNTGIGLQEGRPEPARAAHTGNPADAGQWKTPTLRGVRLSAPFMHDGSVATLEEVVAFYARGGGANPHLDARIAPLPLSAADQANLVAFLRSL
jgi:cytochrome c peroxidase